MILQHIHNLLRGRYWFKVVGISAVTNKQRCSGQLNLDEYRKVAEEKVQKVQKISQEDIESQDF